MKKVYHEVHTAHLTEQEKIYYFAEEDTKIPKSLEERSAEEIINEEGEIPTFWSKIYHTFQ